ncbi:MAG: Kae1-associated kinase Bud32 [Candidatus Bathyarchaeia archaeon]
MAEVEVIAKGAEADLLLDGDWNGKKVIIKRRNQKRYRHPKLDSELRRYRTIHEADIIHRAKRAGIPTPLIYQVSPEEATIVMSYIEGEKVRDIVDRIDDDKRREMFRVIGLQAGRMHQAGIIHGDLTTSNMITDGERIVFIDFGLSEVSKEVEKRGVDLNLMHRMLTSTHFRYMELLKASFKEGYLEEMGERGRAAWDRMKEISRRGRYVEKT